MRQGRLQVGLDREVYQIVSKLAGDNADSVKPKKLTTDVVYDHIKNSNSALKRRKKKELEESIDRALDVWKANELDDDSVEEGDFEGLDGPATTTSTPLKHYNYVNKQITKQWGTKVDMSSLIGKSSNTTREASPEKSMPYTTTERQPNGEAKAKRRKTDSAARGEKKEVDRSPPTGISFDKLGGISDVLEELGELVALPLLNPEVFTRTGIQPTRGVLLHGPPGCGKTMIANALAAEVGVSFIPVSAPSLVAGMSGESEKKIRDLFDEAKKMAPCLVFIDEIDVIMGKRENAQREMERRIVAQMLTCMDELSLDKTDGKAVIVIAATNRPDTLDPALRRAGRFNKEINLGVPNELARGKILRALTKDLLLSEDFDFDILAKMTPGFVGADLNDIVSVAGLTAMHRLVGILRETELITTDMTTTAMDIDEVQTSTSPDEPALNRFRTLIKNLATPIVSDNFTVTFQDFLTAIPKVQPSAKREGFATIPDTTWSHIGALTAVREKLEMAIVQPIKSPEHFNGVGIAAPDGVLLWGPPGCGKTLLAKACANESKANFISVKGPELLNKYVGESERAVRQVFERARSSIPCILFFDELDALVPKREDSLSEASSKVVNTLLTELDGLSNRAGIYVIAATNRPDQIDSAMLRPGRLGTCVLVDLPEPEERVDILATYLRKVLPSVAFPLELVRDVALDQRCKGYSGADLGALHRAAGIAAIKRCRSKGNVSASIEREDWEVALAEVKPSVKDMARYKSLGRKLGV